MLRRRRVDAAVADCREGDCLPPPQLRHVKSAGRTHRLFSPRGIVSFWEPRRLSPTALRPPPPQDGAAPSWRSVGNLCKAVKDSARRRGADSRVEDSPSATAAVTAEIAMADFLIHRQPTQPSTLGHRRRGQLVCPRRWDGGTSPTSPPTAVFAISRTGRSLGRSRRAGCRRSPLGWRSSPGSHPDSPGPR